MFNKSRYNDGEILHYLRAHLYTGMLSALLAMILDSILRAFGVDIHFWKEAVLAGIAGIIFSAFFVPILWRLGLVTLPQYFLGGLALFIPTTLLSLVGKHYFTPLLIDINGLYIEGAGQMWAATLYIRLARSVILFPFYIVAFWFIYHKVMKRHPF